MRLIKFFVLSAILIASLVFADIVNAKPIKFGFVGGRSVEGTIRQWSPLLDYLSREVGIPFEMVLRENYEGLIDTLIKGEIDMFEGGAFSHITAMATGRADILVGEVRLNQRTYKSIFIVRAKDNFHELADLKGARLALTDELSTSGYFLPMIMLGEAGIAQPDDFFKQIVLTGSHDRSIEALLENAIDAAAVGDFFITFLPPGKRANIRVILASEPIPTGPITIRRDFDAGIRKKITAALLAFDKKVPEDIRRITEVDSFFIQDENAYDVVRAYESDFKKLRDLPYFIPQYHRMPAVFSNRIAQEKKNALFWMIGSFTLLFIPPLFAVFKFRRGFLESVGLAVTVIVSVLAALFTAVNVIALFSSLNSFSTEKMSELENTNLRAVAAIEGGQTGILDKILLNAAGNDTVAWANIFRNGRVIASSDENEIGVSIIDKIRTGTFQASSMNMEKDIVNIQDPIIANGERYATLQAGITFRPIAARVKKMITINFMVMTAAMFAGLATAIFARNRLVRPMRAMGVAIERIREGEDSGIEEGEYSDVGQMTASLSRLGKELAEKQKLETLKDYEIAHNEHEWDPEITRELEEKIASMETENESFRRLRMTEAIGQSPAWLRVLRDAAIRARDRDPVVIYGPTGSGKTGIARVIHALSPRSDKPFGEFNCAEFASGDPLIVLGKLFGYGADTGIAGIDRQGQKGILEEFDGGTLFLDEAGVMPLQAQQLLLLPLEGRPFNPAAGKGPARTVNVRFILATNEPLEDLVKTGRMRKDLLRRTFARGIVKIPTLAQRNSDIMLLASYFLAKRNAVSERKIPFSPDAAKFIAGYRFEKYNVSELLGVVDHAFDRALFDGEAKIEPKHLGSDIHAADLLVDQKKHADIESSENYDEDERRELVALRRTNFNITLTEKNLGFTKGSKTLTNRFRGLVYAALTRTKWDKEAAIAEIAGPNHGKETSLQLLEKIADYIMTAKRNLDSGSAEKIFNNLPKKYHPAAEKFLEAIRRGSLI